MTIKYKFKIKMFKYAAHAYLEYLPVLIGYNNVMPIKLNCTKIKNYMKHCCDTGLFVFIFCKELAYALLMLETTVKTLVPYFL